MRGGLLDAEILEPDRSREHEVGHAPDGVVREYVVGYDEAHALQIPLDGRGIGE